MPEEAKLPAFFYRLSPRGQRAYLKSDAIGQYNFVPNGAALARTQALLETLDSGSLAAINQSAQRMIDEVCRVMGVEPVRVEIRGVRPRDPRSELHGLFYPNARPPRMVVWMRTAQRHDVVRPKTFPAHAAARTGPLSGLLRLNLGDSFHTKGFFKRESFLVRALYAAPRETDPRSASRAPEAP